MIAPPNEPHFGPKRSEQWILVRIKKDEQTTEGNSQ